MSHLLLGYKYDFNGEIYFSGNLVPDMYWNPIL
jgi:hypothetical protein